jgi:hypothetical protein
MKASGYLTAFIVFLLISAGCEDDNGNGGNGNGTHKIVGEGPIVTKNLDLSSFNKIENTGVANFNITIGSPQSVVLKAQQNIIDVMTWEVVGQTLKVGLEEDVSIENTEEIRFDITIPSITHITLIGVGNFVLSGDDQDELTIILTGVGNIKAFDMKTGTCTITSTGVGNCEVYVLDKLTVTISGIVNVYYKGDPDITSSIIGLGQLIDAND